MNISTLKREKRKAETNGDVAKRAECCHSLGVHFLFSSKLPQALSEFETELLLRTSLGDQKSIALTHKLLGDCHLESSNFESAVDHLSTALRLLDNTSNFKIDEVARVLVSYGRALLCLAESRELFDRFEDTKRAIDVFKRCLRLIDEALMTEPANVELVSSKICSLINIGILYDSLLDVDRVIISWSQAAKLSKDLNKPEFECRCHLLMSSLSMRRADLPEAERSVARAISLTPKVPQRLITESYLQKALLQIEQRNFGESRRILRGLSSLKMCPESRADLRTRLKPVNSFLRAVKLLERTNLTAEEKIQLCESAGDKAAKINCYSCSLHYYRLMRGEAEVAGVDSKCGEAQFSMGKTYFDVHNFTEAIKCFEICRENYSKTKFEEASVLVEIGDCYSLMCKFDRALEIYSQGIDILAETTNYKILRLFGAKMVKTAERLGSDSQILQAKSFLQSLEGFDDETDQIDTDSSDSSPSEDNKSLFVSKSRPTARKRNEKGETPLHVACIRGNLHRVWSIVEEDPDSTNQRDNCGWTPLHEAANRGHADIVLFLLQQGAYVDDRGGQFCQGVTPLSAAASCGHAHVLHALLDSGADVNLADDQGNRAFECYKDWLRRSGTAHDDSVQRVLDLLAPTEDPPAPVSSPKRAPKVKAPKIQKTRLDEYVEAIRGIKRPRRNLDEPALQIPTNFPALIDEAAFVDDDWIDEEIWEDCGHFSSDTSVEVKTEKTEFPFDVTFRDETFQIVMNCFPSHFELKAAIFARFPSIVGFTPPIEALRLRPARSVYRDESISLEIDASELDLPALYDMACHHLKVSPVGSIPWLRDSFSLSMEMIEPSSLPPISSVLRCVSSLTSLDLSGNYVDDDSFLRFLVPVVRFTSLESLNLSSNSLTCRSLTALGGIGPRLRALSLSYNFLEDPEVAVSLVPLLDRLESLQLRSCSLPRDLLADPQLCRALQGSKLEYLDLAGNKLNISADLLNMSRISHLDLSSSKLFPGIDSLFVSRSLRNLILCNCCLTDDVFGQLYGKLAGLRLTELNVSHNSGICVWSLVQFVQNPVADLARFVDCGIKSPLHHVLFTDLNGETPFKSLAFSVGGLLVREVNKLRALGGYGVEVNDELVVLSPREFD